MVDGIDFNPSLIPPAHLFSYLPLHEERTTTQTLMISFCNVLKTPMTGMPFLTRMAALGASMPCCCLIKD